MDAAFIQLGVRAAARVKWPRATSPWQITSRQRGRHAARQQLESVMNLLKSHRPQHDVISAAAAGVVIYAMAGVAVSGAYAQQADASITLLDPINVQQIGSLSPQGLTIDSTGNLVYSNGQGFSSYFDPWTLQGLGGANLGSFNGLDYNVITGIHAGSGLGGEFAVFTDPSNPGSGIDVFQSGLQAATAISAHDNHALIFGFNNQALPALVAQGYDGSTLGSTEYTQNTMLNGMSNAGNNKFFASEWNFATGDSSIKEFNYEITDSGSIDLTVLNELGFAGFHGNGVYQGIHKDGDHLWVGFTTNELSEFGPGQNFLLYAQIPAPGACSGDLNGDGQVNVTDLLALLSAWGPCGDRGECPADLNDDGAVDVLDLLQLLGAWGNCPR